jgi:hypothetical protein
MSGAIPQLGHSNPEAHSNLLRVNGLRDDCASRTVMLRRQPIGEQRLWVAASGFGMILLTGHY